MHGIARKAMPNKSDKLAKHSTTEIEIGGLYEQVRQILDAAKSRAARSISSEMVAAYWHIGQAIVEREQAGEARAGYGERLIEMLSVQMKAEGLKGFGRNNLWYMRQFYLTYSENPRAAWRIELDALPPAFESRIRCGARVLRN